MPPPPELEDGEDDTLDASDEEEGAVAGENHARDVEGDDPRDGNRRAAERIGRSLYAHLEVIHMTDRDRAVRLIEEIVPLIADLAELATDLDTVGAGALARDVRLAVDRQERQAAR